MTLRMNDEHSTNGSRRHWTKEELEYLENRWGQASIPCIADYLGRSVNGVRQKAAKIGLESCLRCGDRLTFSQFCKAIGNGGKVREYGTDRHDCLVLQEDGSLHYYNLQNGEGTGKGSRIFNGGIGYHTFLSIEPLLGSLDAGLGSFSTCEWVIVGAETGRRKGKVAPKPDWIANIVKTAKITQAAVFLKDSKEMRTAVGDLVDKWRELPPELQHKEEK